MIPSSIKSTFSIYAFLGPPGPAGAEAGQMGINLDFRWSANQQALAPNGFKDVLCQETNNFVAC